MADDNLFIIGTGTTILGVIYGMIRPIIDRIRMIGKSDTEVQANNFIKSKPSDLRKYLNNIIIGGCIALFGAVILAYDA